MAGSVDSLVIAVELTAGKDDEDKQIVGFAKAWAINQYSCTGSSCVAAVTSYPKFISVLKGYSTIGKLAILAHSTSDSLIFPGPLGVQQTSLTQIGKDLGTHAPHVGEAEFLGCEVGRDPVAMWDFGLVLNATSIAATNWFHYFQRITVPTSPGDTEADVKTALGDEAGYLIPRTNITTLLTHPGSKVQVWIEWFRQDLIEGQKFEAVLQSIRTKRFRQRGHGNPVQISSRADAQKLKAGYQANPVPDFDEITVGFQ